MKFSMKTIVFALLQLVILLPADVKSAKILALFPFPGPSQYILVQPYLKALAARGHELTVINAFPQKQPVKNYRDVTVLEVFDNYEGKYEYIHSSNSDLILFNTIHPLFTYFQFQIS